MKLIIVNITFLICTNYCLAQINTIFHISTVNNNSDVIKKNNIQKEVIYNFTFVKDDKTDSSIFKTIDYNVMGDIIQETIFIGNNPSTTNYSYVYNQFGKISKITKSTGKSIISINEFDYDSIGNEIVKYNYNQDTTFLTIEQKNFDKNNNLIQLVTKINNSEAYISRKFFYDTDNKIIKIDALDPSGNIIFSNITEYNGFESSMYLLNDRGKILESIITKNSNGFVTKLRMTKFNKTEEYSYYSDNTIYQCVVLININVKQTYKHYYFK